MTWSEVALAIVLGTPSLGFTLFVTVLCVYGVVIGIIRSIRSMYMSRQAMLAVKNIDEKELASLLKKLVKDLELDEDRVEVKFE